MKNMSRRIIVFVLAGTMSIVWPLTVTATENSSQRAKQQKTDLEIVNEYTITHKSIPIPEDAIKLMKRDGSWSKIVKFVEAQNANDTSLTYTVQFTEDGCAVLPKGESVKIKSVPIDNQTQYTYLLSKSIAYNSMITDGYGAYWRADFDASLYSEATILQPVEITYGNMQFRYFYQTNSTHNIWVDSEHFLYCYDTSPNTVTYREIEFNGITNKTYSNMKIFVNNTGFLHHIYGDIYDLLYI